MCAHGTGGSLVCFYSHVKEVYTGSCSALYTFIYVHTFTRHTPVPHVHLMYMTYAGVWYTHIYTNYIIIHTDGNSLQVHIYYMNEIYLYIL